MITKLADDQIISNIASVFEKKSIEDVRSLLGLYTVLGYDMIVSDDLDFLSKRSRQLYFS